MTKTLIDNFISRAKHAQSDKARRNIFKTIFPDGNAIYSMSAEQLEEFEIQMLKGFEVDYQRFGTERDIDITTLDDGQVNTRRQTTASFITLKENCEILTADKQFTPAKSYPILPPIREGRVDELKVSMGKAVIDGKNCYLRKQEHVKIEMVDSVAKELASEFSLYAMPGGEQGKDTLLIRMDKARPHDNKAFFGENARVVLKNQAQGYHFHISNAFVSSLCSKGAVKNAVSTECDAISSVELAAYLKALDGKSVPELGGVDLNQTFGLPFKYMQEHGLFPQMDLSGVATRLQSSANSDIAKACSDYLSLTAQPNTFESFTNALDFFNQIHQIQYDLSQAGLTAEAESLTSIINEMAGQTFDGLTKTYERENVQAQEEGLESVDTATSQQNEQAALPVVEPEKQAEAPQVKDEPTANALANELVDRVEKELSGEISQTAQNEQSNDMSYATDMGYVSDTTKQGGDDGREA